MPLRRAAVSCAARRQRRHRPRGRRRVPDPHERARGCRARTLCHSRAPALGQPRASGTMCSAGCSGSDDRPHQMQRRSTAGFSWVAFPMNTKKANEKPSSTACHWRRIVSAASRMSRGKVLTEQGRRKPMEMGPETTDSSSSKPTSGLYLTGKAAIKWT
jgi:hypothetical protein